MQLIGKFNQEFRILLCVIDICIHIYIYIYIYIYRKHAWVISFKDKKAITINNAFQINLGDSNCKSNKIWVDKGSEFYNRSMKS